MVDRYMLYTSCGVRRWGGALSFVRHGWHYHRIISQFRLRHCQISCRRARYLPLWRACACVVLIVCAVGTSAPMLHVYLDSFHIHKDTRTAADQGHRTIVKEKDYEKLLTNQIANVLSS